MAFALRKILIPLLGHKGQNVHLHCLVMFRDTCPCHLPRSCRFSFSVVWITGSNFSIHLLCSHLRSSMARSSPSPADTKTQDRMEKGSPLVTSRVTWWPLLNSVHVPRRLKALWPFLLLFHLLSAIFIIALIVFIRNTATEHYGTADSDNIYLILSHFPFPPPTASPYPFHSVNLHDHSPPSPSNLTKRWGHFDRLPTSQKCYQQERTAALISLFGGGVLGADQLYAGNLRLGLTRLLLQVGAWCLLIVCRGKLCRNGTGEHDG